MTGNLWVGIRQRDMLQKGHYRDYKFYKSGIDVPNTNAYWANKYLPYYHDPEACGILVPLEVNSKFHDHLCTTSRGLVCEW